MENWSSSLSSCRHPQTFGPRIPLHHQLLQYPKPSTLRFPLSISMPLHGLQKSASLFFLSCTPGHPAILCNSCPDFFAGLSRSVLSPPLLRLRHCDLLSSNFIACIFRKGKDADRIVLWAQQEMLQFGNPSVKIVLDANAFLRIPLPWCSRICSDTPKLEFFLCEFQWWVRRWCSLGHRLEGRGGFHVCLGFLVLFLFQGNTVATLCGERKCLRSHNVKKRNRTIQIRHHVQKRNQNMARRSGSKRTNIHTTPTVTLTLTYRQIQLSHSNPCQQSVPHTLEENSYRFSLQPTSTPLSPKLPLSSFMFLSSLLFVPPTSSALLVCVVPQPMRKFSQCMALYSLINFPSSLGVAPLSSNSLFFAMFHNPFCAMKTYNFKFLPWPLALFP